MDQFDAYGHAIAALILLALLWAGLGPFSAMMKEKAGAAPGGSVPEDYGNVAYRAHRAYANLTEFMPAFGVAVVAAVLAGASPFWINLFAAIAVLGRIAMAVVHVRGLGKASGGLRSMLYGLSWLMTILCGLFGLVAVF